MPLTDTEKLEIRDAFSIPPGKDWMGNEFLASSALERYMRDLPESSVLLVRETLEEWKKNRFDAGTLKGEYNVSGAGKRSRIRQRLSNLIGFDPIDYIDNQPGLSRA